MRIHIVQKGETLWRIAKHYGIGLDELKRLNAHLANPDYIVPGMEIVLPESVNAPENPGTKVGMTKEQQTAPITSKAVETAPKEIMTKEQPKPIKEIPKVVETAPMPPKPAPMPQLDLTPQFHFDFAPQMHFQQPQHMPQPQPMPMPMPQPQPIFIEMPQPMPMPQPQVQQVQQVVEKEVEKEVEYVPIPQPHIVYVPFIPHPQPQPKCHHPMPCRCNEKHFHHPSPCGCNEQPFYHQPSPCGCFEPQPINYDCGCQGGYSPQDVMSYNMPYFEPNYDISPVMDTNYQEDEGLPDWLVDSSSIGSDKNDDFPQYVMSEQYEDYTDDKESNVAGVADYNQDMYNYDHGVQPSHAYYGNNNMQQVMPQQMMPYMMPQQQSMYPNCHRPYMNPYSSHYTPWNY